MKGEPVENPLAASFNLILESLGVQAVDLPLHEARIDAKDTIEWLCERAGIRSRQVKVSHLTADSAQGPLLLFSHDNQQPFVMLNDLNGQARLIDPCTQTSRVVTSLKDGVFHPMGYYFYAPLPQKQLRLRELLHWCLTGKKDAFKKIILTAFAASFLSALFPILIGLLFDDVLPSSWTQGLAYFMAAFIVIATSYLLLSLSLHHGIMRLMQKIAHDAEAAIVDRVLDLPPKFFRQNAAGDIAYRAFSVDAARQLLTDQLFGQALLGVFSLVNFVVLFYYSYQLASWIFSAMALYAIVVLSLFVWFQRANKKEGLFASHLAGLEFQILAGISKIRAAGAESRMFSKWLQASKKQSGEGALSERIARYIAIINAGSEIFVLALVLVALRVHAPLRLTPGGFLAFLSATTFVSASIFRLGRITLQTLDAYPLMRQLAPILGAIPEGLASKNDPGVLSGRIDLSHLSFHYEEGRKQVLFDVNLSAEPGDFVAIVGPSGSGKSTLLKLLLGFDSPSSGTIYFDGQDLSILSLQKVRQQMGVVLQQGHLFPGSILDNIIGNSLLSIDDAWKAAQKCALDEDIRKLPMGMYTMIGEGGGALSGGQRQRILIARAIARGPRILLFDEATSALDNATQDVVTQSLNALNVTRIVIAHRLSTIKHANKICVLHGGRIVEVGTYDELLALNGHFTDLAKRQIA